MVRRTPGDQRREQNAPVTAAAKREVPDPPAAGGAAEMAQAREFYDLLRTELSELESLAARIGMCCADQPWQYPHLRRTHGRIREVRHLIDGLMDRFPQL